MYGRAPFGLTAGSWPPSSRSMSPKPKRSAPKSGVCKLTGKRGAFVQAHLIPRAFSRLPSSPLPSLQLTIGERPIRRWTGWYDDELVVRQGEDILMKLDSWAVGQLRRHRMVWSGWGSARTLGDLHRPIADSGWGFRRVEGIDLRKLRLFFHSLLWRAAATTRPEFADVTLPDEDLEQLRLMLTSAARAPIDFYPVKITQLSTMGPIHNCAPIADTKRIPAIDDLPAQDLPIFRFYFDGLVAHFHRHARDDGSTAELGHLVVGGDDKLTFGTQTYERSTQSLMVDTVSARALDARPIDAEIARALRWWR